MWRDRMVCSYGSANLLHSYGNTSTSNDRYISIMCDGVTRNRFNYWYMEEI